MSGKQLTWVHRHVVPLNLLQWANYPIAFVAFWFTPLWNCVLVNSPSWLHLDKKLARPQRDAPAVVPAHPLLPCIPATQWNTTLLASSRQSKSYKTVTLEDTKLGKHWGQHLLIQLTWLACFNLLEQVTLFISRSRSADTKITLQGRWLNGNCSCRSSPKLVPFPVLSSYFQGSYLLPLWKIHEDNREISLLMCLILL